jgi:hypothetical protein
VVGTGMGQGRQRRGRRRGVGRGGKPTGTGTAAEAGGTGLGGGEGGHGTDQYDPSWNKLSGGAVAVLVVTSLLYVLQAFSRCVLVGTLSWLLGLLWMGTCSLVIDSHKKG